MTTHTLKKRLREMIASGQATPEQLREVLREVQQMEKMVRVITGEGK
jgi:hypothetical protein